MDVPQIPNMAEPIAIPENSVVKNGKLSNKICKKKSCFSRINNCFFFFLLLKFSSVKITKKKQHATA